MCWLDNSPKFNLMLESIGGTTQLNKLRCDYCRVFLKPAVLKI